MRHHFCILEITLLFYTIQNKSEKKKSCYDNAYMYLTVALPISFPKPAILGKERESLG
jgi:hypothetical protein